MLYDILNARTKPSDKALYNIWARKLSSGWTEQEITGTLPLTFNSRAEHALTDYTVHGTAEGAGVETENLFDSTKRQSYEGFWNNTGGYVSSSGWYGTLLIDVEPSTEYSFDPNSTAGASAKHLFYDENGGMIGYISSGRQTFTTPDNCVMMRFSYRSSSSNIMLVKGSTVPATYIPYGYKIPLTVESGQNADTYPLYIGNTQLRENEYLDYAEQKIYKDVSGTLTPTDPPAAFPAITAYAGENTLSSTETVGNVTIKGKIKAVT